MHYEINVAVKRNSSYFHLFATDERSVTTEVELKFVYGLIKTAFPEPLYKVDVTRWQTTGKGIDMEGLMKEK